MTEGDRRPLRECLRAWLDGLAASPHLVALLLGLALIGFATLVILAVNLVPPVLETARDFWNWLCWSVEDALSELVWLKRRMAWWFSAHVCRPVAHAFGALGRCLARILGALGRCWSSVVRPILAKLAFSILAVLVAALSVWLTLIALNHLKLVVLVAGSFFAVLLVIAVWLPPTATTAPPPAQPERAPTPERLDVLRLLRPGLDQTDPSRN